MRKVFLLLKFLLAFCSLGYSQVLDPSFGNAGKLVLAGVKADGLQVPTAVQTDGKIVVAGYTADGTDIVICRLNSNGTFDNSFGSNGKMTLDLNGTIAEGLSDLKIQSDGKIVVSGNAAVARLNTNGSPDLNFNGTGKVSVDIQVNRMLLQSDGKIVLAGNQSYDISLIRLNSNGSFDAGFGTIGKVIFPAFAPIGQTGQSTLTGIDQQSDNKIVITGYSKNNTTGDVDFYSMRLNTNGTPDNTYAGGVGFTFVDISNEYNVASSQSILSSNKILIAGFEFTSYPPTIQAAMLNEDGSPDNSFSEDGTVSEDISTTNEFRLACAIQEDGKILLAARVWNQNYDFALLRLNADGSRDNSLNSNGLLTIDFNNAFDAALNVVALPDKQVLLTGNTSGEVGLVRVLTVQRNYYRDNDGDGFGNNIITDTYYYPQPGYVVNNTDCNDNFSAVYPGAAELCNNNMDDDCDGQIDEGCVPPNSDPVPMLSFHRAPNTYSGNPAAINERNTGIQNVWILIQLDRVYHLPVTVQYQTLGHVTGIQSATAPDDYVQAAGSVTFQPNERRKYIAIQVKGDRLYELSEFFHFHIFNSVNAMIPEGSDNMLFQILNDDSPPTVRIYDANATERSGLAKVRVTINKVCGTPILVYYQLINGSAERVFDFSGTVGGTGNIGVVKFLPGETAKLIPIVIHHDAINEPIERFWVRVYEYGDSSTVIRVAEVATVWIVNSPLEQSKTTTKSSPDDSQVAISPNPTNQLLNLRPFIKAGPNKLNIQLIDQSGRVVKQWTNSYSAEGQLISLPVADVASGIYMIVIQDGKIRRLQQKVVIQH